MRPAAEFTIASAFPGWLPDLIREDAAKVVRGHISAGNDPTPVIRLATDDRMQAVWGELSKAQRDKAGRSYYRVDGNIQAAMLALFRGALTCYRNAPTALTQSDLDESKQRWLARAELLREIEGELTDLGIHGAASALPKYATVLPGLAAAAEFYQRYAETIEVAPDMLVERRRLDPRIRGFLAYLLSVTRSIFHQSLFGIVATIASVLFETEISKTTATKIDRALKGAE